MRAPPWLLFACAAASCVAGAAPARADAGPGAGPGAGPEVEATRAIVLPVQGAEHARGAAREVAQVIADVAQDLGLVLDVDEEPLEPPPRDEASIARAARERGVTIVAPQVRPLGRGVYELRMLLADPRRRALALRVERAEAEELPVRAAVMLRDLVDPSAPPRRQVPEEPGEAARLAEPARSAGRAILAGNATLYGGLFGYATLRASGSDDPRLLYPLLAVGAGVGLGAAIIVAEEWDVGVGDAWFLASGGWWPTIAGHLTYEGRFGGLPGAREEERWVYGIVYGTAGLGLASLGLSLRGMGDGGAMLAHSGGGLGLAFGGLVETLARGDLEPTPFTGMGFGAALGWLGAAAAATQVRVSPQRVLGVDVGVVLGGLGGAALGSPLLFDAPTETQTRLWASSVLAGSLLGGGVALFLSSERRTGKANPPPGSPVLGVLGRTPEQDLVLGLGWGGGL